MYNSIGIWVYILPASDPILYVYKPISPQRTILNPFVNIYPATVISSKFFISSRNNFLTFFEQRIHQSNHENFGRNFKPKNFAEYPNPLLPSDAVRKQIFFGSSLFNIVTI